jgi:DNA (cytosine-5)-methyltransferase 1
VATDVSRLAIPDGKGLRRLSIREGLRLFGFPEWYEIPTNESNAFDLLGNTVAVPVVEFVASCLAQATNQSLFLESSSIYLDNTPSEHNQEQIVSFG